MDIVAITRTLRVEDVEAAYRHGLFPMGSDHRGVFTWHQPDPRGVIPLDGFHCSRSLARTIRRGHLSVTFDRAFQGVMQGCGEGRPVWITREVREVYRELHRRGQAHSVEVWHEGRLAGGLYGVHLGGGFFAESKFHRVTDASKVALKALVDRLNQGGFLLLDVQYVTPHLQTLGAVWISGREYQRRLRAALQKECVFA